MLCTVHNLKKKSSIEHSHVGKTFSLDYPKIWLQYCNFVQIKYVIVVSDIIELLN